jgi:hypothetical protein
LRLSLPKRSEVAAGVLSETGARIGARQIRDRIRVRLPAGRYFVSLRASQPLSARYALGLQIREITKTVLAVDTATVPARQRVTLRATVTPSSASVGIVRIKVDYLDPFRVGVREQFKPRVVGTHANSDFLPPKIADTAFRPGSSAARAQAPAPVAS